MKIIPNNNANGYMCKSMFASFKSERVNNGYRVKSYTRSITQNDKFKAAIGSITGAAISVAIMMKKQKINNPLKLKYDLKDMVTVSTTSILGGVGLGLIDEDKDVKQNRINEGFFQFMNAVVPTCIVGYLLNLCESSSKYNTKKHKIIAIVGGLIFGMFGAATLTNLITDPMDKYPDRKINAKDTLANIDDGLGALVLAKVPLVDKLNVAGLLPIIYASCGYRAGKSN